MLKLKSLYRHSLVKALYYLLKDEGGHLVLYELWMLLMLMLKLGEVVDMGIALVRIVKLKTQVVKGTLLCTRLPQDRLRSLR